MLSQAKLDVKLKFGERIKKKLYQNLRVYLLDIREAKQEL